MRWSDIPAFTRSGSYEIDMPLNSLESWIEQQSIPEVGLNLEPDFQRAHVWTPAQRTAYVEYFLRGGRSNRVIYFNKPSWSNEVEPGAYDEFVIVDGKQRLESLRQFVRDQIPAFGCYYSQFTGRLSLSRTMKIHVNDLKSRREVLQWYLDMNTGGVVHTDEEIEKVRLLLKEENDDVR